LLRTPTSPVILWVLYGPRVWHKRIYIYECSSPGWNPQERQNHLQTLSCPYSSHPNTPYTRVIPVGEDSVPSSNPTSLGHVFWCKCETEVNKRSSNTVLHSQEPRNGWNGNVQIWKMIFQILWFGSTMFVSRAEPKTSKLLIPPVWMLSNMVSPKPRTIRNDLGPIIFNLVGYCLPPTLSHFLLLNIKHPQSKPWWIVFEPKNGFSFH
jgi:hypothetical protein